MILKAKPNKLIRRVLVQLLIVEPIQSEIRIPLLKLIEIIIDRAVPPSFEI